jgi:hypothetical protein
MNNALEIQAFAGLTQAEDVEIKVLSAKLFQGCAAIVETPELLLNPEYQRYLSLHNKRFDWFRKRMN